MQGPGQGQKWCSYQKVRHEISDKIIAENSKMLDASKRKDCTALKSSFALLNVSIAVILHNAPPPRY